MKIIFFIVLLKLISADENNDNQFIETLPADIKKTLLDKISRRILEEVPEVDMESGATNGELIDAKLEEQGEFVKKILREEIDSLKARRKNEDDTLEVHDGDDNATVARSNSKVEHIDLTKRAKTKRAGEDDNLHGTQVSTKNLVDKTKEVTTVFNIEREDTINENVTSNILRLDDKKDYSEFTLTKEINPLKDIPSKLEEKIDTAQKENENIKLNIQREDAGNDVSKIQSAITNSSMEFESKGNSIKVVPSKMNLSPSGVIGKKLLKNNEDKSTSPNADEKNKIKNMPQTESTTIKELPTNIVNLTKKATEELKNDDGKQKSGSIMPRIPKLEEGKNIPKTLSERNGSLLGNDTSNEYLENKSPTETVLTKIDIAQKIEETIKSEKLTTVKPIQRNYNVLYTVSTTTTDVPYSTAFTKTFNSGISIIKKEISETPNVRSKENSTVNLKNDTEVKKPCNKTKTSDGIKSDCDTKSDVTTEGTTIPIKVILSPVGSLSKSKTRQVSAEHFGDLRNGTEYQVFEIDENKSPFVEVKKTENVDQPHYFPVYNYEPRNVYYNAENRFGPNIESERTDLRSNVKGQRKLSSFEHFGDLQVSRGYQVFETDSNTQFDQENRNENLDESQYYPVYSYDPQNVYYNAYNRLGPNEDDAENDTDDRNTEIELITVIDGKRMLEGPEQRSLNKSKRKRHVETLNEKNKRYENYLSPSEYPEFEAYHPYQVIKKGLKGELEATRHILNRNQNISYSVIHGKDVEREEYLGNKKSTMWGNTYEIDSEYDTDLSEDSSEYEKVSENGINSLIDFLIKLREKKRQNKPQQVGWSPDDNRVIISGGTYDLKGLNYPGQKGNKVDNKISESRLPLYAFANPEKMPYESVEQLYGEENDKNFADHFIMNLNYTRPDYINTTDRDKMLVTLKDLKKSEIKPSETEGGSDLEEYPKHFIEWHPETKLSKKEQKGEYFSEISQPKVLRFRVDTNENEWLSQSTEDSEKKPYKIDTIEKIISITPELDVFPILEEAMKKNISIMRSNADDYDVDIETHLNILKDLVQLDSSGLEKYDWLGTTVDIQAALTKLTDLVMRRNSFKFIHPADLQLLKYVEAIYKNAKKIASERAKENIPLITPLYNSEKNNKRLPKYKAKIPNALNVINKLYKVRSTVNLETFLLDIKNGLEDFHVLIKEISKVTKFKNQRWYKNIKALYLVNEGRKEYLEVLLHLFSTRLFGLIEESLKNGAEDNYLTYMRQNRAEVDRTEAEVIFIMKILKAIENLNA